MIGSHLARLRQEFKMCFGETVAEVMDAEVEEGDEIHPSRRPRVAERAAIHVPPEVEAQNLDSDFNEFLRSSPNPVVALVFGVRAIIQKGGSVSKISRDEVSVFELWR